MNRNRPQGSERELGEEGGRERDLCKQSYLVSQGHGSNDDCYDDVQDVVENVGDEPVGPATQAVLFHHYQLLLKLVLHQSRREHLHTRDQHSSVKYTNIIGIYH